MVGLRVSLVCFGLCFFQSWHAQGGELPLETPLESSCGELPETNSERLSREEDRYRLGAVVESFELLSFSGRSYSWPGSEPPAATVLVFIGTECPLAKLYVHRLKGFVDEFAKDDVQFLAIDSNSQDSNLEMESFARRMQLNMPLLRDPAAKLADRVGATRTPEVFLIDSSCQLRYAGRIDNQYGVGFSRPTAEREDLKMAIRAVLTGDEVEVPQTEPVGCLIGRLPQQDGSSAVTYRNQISRLLQTHCVECHRPGQIGPQPLDNYDDAAGWADMLVEVVDQGRMPPWNADSEIGDFENARGMTTAEKELLSEWANAGAPLGEDATPPKPNNYLEGWRLPREPDQVVEMAKVPFKVPAEGVVEYQYFVVDPGFKEEKWVQAAEVIPGEPGVVHHAIVFFRAPGSANADHLGWIGGYVPGQKPSSLPDGQARRIPAGSRFIFQMHYTPNGRPAVDNTKIGLCFADKADVKREVITIPAVEREFEIPPHASAFLVENSMSGFPAGSTLLGITPHMHVRGKSFRATIERKESNSDIPLLRVPDYDFNWQHSYRLLEPIELDATVELKSRYLFDNSSDNLANPDPTAYVRWGDQTFQEMAVTFFDIALPEGKTSQGLMLERRSQKGEDIASAASRVTEFLLRFDKNRDGVLHRNEVSESFATFAFDRYDADGDNVITEAELRGDGEKR